MKKYKLYVHSEYIYLDNQEKTTALAKQLLNLGINVELSVEELIKEKEAKTKK